MMLALNWRESGGERESDDTFWEGLLLEEPHRSGPIGNIQHLDNKSTANDLPTARDQEVPPIKPDAAQSVTSQNDQHMQRRALQEMVKASKYPSRETLSSKVKSSGSLQNGLQGASCEPRLASSCPNGPEPVKEMAHSHTKAEEKDQEGLGAVGAQPEYLTNPKQIQMRTDSLNGSVVHSLATGSLKSFRRRKPQSWPNPKDSLGYLIDKNNKKIKGKVWVAEGPALELFEAQIRPQIERLLHSTEPPQCAPLLLTLYMIGKKETSANPVVMICCCDRKARKDAEALIRESDILQQFPQVGLGNSASLLETSAFVVPAGGRSSASQLDAQIPSGRLEIHGLKKPVIGRRLRFVMNADGRQIVRFTTGGPFIRIEKHTYQLTATHISQDMGTDSEMQFDSDDDCEYDGLSDTDTEEEEETTEQVDDGHDGIETGSQGNLQEIRNTPLETGVTSHIIDSDKKVSLERLYRHDLWIAQDTKGVDQTFLKPSKVDFFLVKLPAGEAEKASNVIDEVGNYRDLEVTDIAALPKPGTEVVVVTPYSHLTGFVLPGNTRVKMHGFYGFQNLLAVRLSSSIKPGDSGSAVLDANTGCLYGHITLGSAPDTIAYMVPSIDTFAEIVAVFGKLPTLKVEPPTPAFEMPWANIQNAQDEWSISTSSSELWEDSKELTIPLGPQDAVESNIPRLRSRETDRENMLIPHETAEDSRNTVDERVPFVPSEPIPIYDSQMPMIWR